MTKTDDEQKKNGPLKRQPISKPPFTIGDIKKAIPPHCFHRSLLRSFSYVARDLLQVYILYYIASSNLLHSLPSSASYVAWPAYWIAQGCVFLGIWVLGHECGHHAFSDYPWIDNSLGFILNSAILIPHFSWKYSHRRHHSNTSSLERDENYVPRIKSDLIWFSKYSTNSLERVIGLTLLLTLGWPLYLAFNVLGRRYERFASHYDPYSPIYNDRERLQIYISNIGVLTTAFVMYRVALTKGLAWLVCIYVAPLQVMNSLIILISFLNHTHASVPHYDSSEWDWLRGALATVDRDFGVVLNKVFHHISDTHVLHHLFSIIPHYHALEATKAIKPILGDYHSFDSTPIYKAIWREFKECVYVEKDEGSQGKGIFWYKNKL